MILDERDTVNAILHIRNRVIETRTDFLKLFIMPQYITGKNGNRRRLPQTTAALSFAL